MVIFEFITSVSQAENESSILVTRLLQTVVETSAASKTNAAHTRSTLGQLIQPPCGIALSRAINTLDALCAKAICRSFQRVT